VLEILVETGWRESCKGGCRDKGERTHVRAPEVAVVDNLKGTHMRLDAMNVQKMEGLIKTWDVDLDAFLAKADQPGMKFAVGFRDRIEKVKSQCKSAQDRLDQIKAVGCFRWQVFEAGMDGAWKKLDAAFRKLTLEERSAAIE
jgi:hypothetical protein